MIEIDLEGLRDLYKDRLVRRIVITPERIGMLEDVHPRTPFIPVDVAYPDLVTEKERYEKSLDIKRIGFIALEFYYEDKYIEIRRVFKDDRELTPREFTSKTIKEIIPKDAKIDDQTIDAFLRSYPITYSKLRN